MRLPLLFAALWALSCSAEPSSPPGELSSPPGEVAEGRAGDSLRDVLGDQTDAVEAVFSRAGDVGVEHVVLMKGGPTLDHMKVRRVVIWNLAARVVYPDGPPEGYGRYEPGLKAIPELQQAAIDSGFAPGYREDVLYEIWKDIPMAISMKLQPSREP